MGKRKAKKLTVASNFEVVARLEPDQLIHLRKFKNLILDKYGQDLGQAEQDADQAPGKKQKSS
jgi:hypothetical protein